MKTITFVPLCLAILFTKISGFIGYYLIKQIRVVSLINLKQAFPDKSFKERNKIGLKSFQNMLITFVEFLHSAKDSDEAIMKRLIIENGHLMDDLLARKKGVVAITGHIGNWEFLAFYFGIKKYSPHIIIRSLDNAKLNKYLRILREKRGSTCIDRKRGDLRLFFKALKDNTPLAFLCDQNFLEGVYVDFFGELAATATGPIALALKTGSPILLSYAKPLKHGKHKLVMLKEFILEMKDTKEETILHNTQRYTKELEKIIRENPENWLWSHPRWNTRPNNEPEIFYKRDDYKC